MMWTYSGTLLIVLSTTAGFPLLKSSPRCPIAELLPHRTAWFWEPVIAVCSILTSGFSLFLDRPCVVVLTVSSGDALVTDVWIAVVHYSVDPVAISISWTIMWIAHDSCVFIPWQAVAIVVTLSVINAWKWSICQACPTFYRSVTVMMGPKSVPCFMDKSACIFPREKYNCVEIFIVFPVAHVPGSWDQTRKMIEHTSSDTHFPAGPSQLRARMRTMWSADCFSSFIFNSLSPRERRNFIFSESSYEPPSTTPMTCCNVNTFATSAKKVEYEVLHLGFLCDQATLSSWNVEPEVISAWVLGSLWTDPHFWYSIEIKLLSKAAFISSTHLMYFSNGFWDLPIKLMRTIIWYFETSSSALDAPPSRSETNQNFAVTIT